MTGTTPLLALTYPTSTDAASPAGIQTLAQQLEKYEVGVFATTAARDSAWTAAGGLANGALAFISGTGELQLRAGGAWVVTGGRAQSFAMASGTASVTTAAALLSGPTAVTFPAGRFSVAPVLTATISSTSGNLGAGSSARTDAITTSGFNMYIVSSTNSAAGTATACHWDALQATSASAAG